MRVFQMIPFLSFAVSVLLGCTGAPAPITEAPSPVKPTEPATATAPAAKASPANRHEAFAVLQGEFSDGPAVTKACLSCHKDVGTDLIETAHWTWRGPTPGVTGKGSGSTIGKINLINNFCIAVPGNEGRCAQCHVGYGWVDSTFDFKDPSRADCLACHDGTGTYRKAKTGGGFPEPEVNLGEVARSVQKSSRATCGSCHFYGGGDDNVKLPNMGTRLLHATAEVDIHMGGEGFACTECHQAEGHRIAGSGAHLPVSERSLSCEACHEGAVHDDEDIEAHLAHIACQACHIPLLGRSQPTKVDWLWSKAGDATREEAPNEFGKATYLKKKGAFQWAQGTRPVLAWFDGRTRRMVLGDVFDPTQTPVSLAAPVATIHDATAKLYPFKVMRGDQPADAKRHVLLPPHLAGKGAGPKPFWKFFDWGAALSEGAAAAGIPYSGEYEFVSTEMYMSASHGVAPASQALGCDACHEGGIDFKALGYPGDPMEVGGRNFE